MCAEQPGTERAGRRSPGCPGWRGKPSRGLAAMLKALVLEPGLRQVEGTEMPQGTRLRVLQPGTKRSASSFLPQQAPLCQFPAQVKKRGEETKWRPKWPVHRLPGSSSWSLFCLRPRCNTHRYCSPSEPPPAQTCAVAGSCGQWGWPPGQP